MMPLSLEQEAKLRSSHTKQIEIFIRQIHKFTEKNFPVNILPDGTIESYTCTPHYIRYAGKTRVEELKMYVDLLQRLLQEEEQNPFWHETE